jgi:hypothetical protein
MTREELMNVLCRYEGAIQEVNDGNSEAAILEMEAAREALMDVLMKVKGERNEG